MEDRRGGKEGIFLSQRQYCNSNISGAIWDRAAFLESQPFIPGTLSHLGSGPVLEGKENEGPQPGFCSILSSLWVSTDSLPPVYSYQPACCLPQESLQCRSCNYSNHLEDCVWDTGVSFSVWDHLLKVLGDQELQKVFFGNTDDNYFKIPDVRYPTSEAKRYQMY